jgi:hypothetical protein
MLKVIANFCQLGEGGLVIRSWRLSKKWRTTGQGFLLC